MLWKVLLSSFVVFVAIRGIVATDDGCDSPLDLFFVLDGSSSVGPPNFRKVKEFTADVVSKFTVGPNNTLVGVIQFSHYSRMEFNLGEYMNMTTTLSAINAIKYQKGATYTPKALDRARKEALWRGEAVPKVMIVLSDGRSAIDVTEASKALADAGIIVYAIGVGRADHDELLLIANNDLSKVIELSDFNALIAEIDLLAEVVCEVAHERADPCYGQPCLYGGTCLRINDDKDYRCECAEGYEGTNCETVCGIDVVFVVDRSSSIQGHRFDAAKQFISDFAQCFADQSIGIGLIGYDCVPSTIIPLGMHTAGDAGLMYSLYEASYTGGLSGITGAISFMVHTSVFRDDVPRAAVIITDGSAQGDADGLVMGDYADQADEARDAGITVYSVPNGIPGFEDIVALEAISGGPDNVFSMYDPCQLAIRILLDLYPCGLV
ncbi:von Willebrand factor A domain-containing protein 2-like [Branchiostoma floridae]|uniref:von Willebrand factor A domain-containing protein 2-like n=1 Tax=Branchiostoma floridae TaxID=7739 RepID=A0A9J7MZK5_BRAFL|nr:von Willebrand factor A domain-containing protein 2-like [Branchiostoma floridae]